MLTQLRDRDSPVFGKVRLVIPQWEIHKALVYLSYLALYDIKLLVGFNYLPPGPRPGVPGRP